MAASSPHLVPRHPSPDRFTVNSVAQVSAHSDTHAPTTCSQGIEWAGRGEGKALGPVGAREGSSLSGWRDECVHEEEEGDSDARCLLNGEKGDRG